MFAVRRVKWNRDHKILLICLVYFNDRAVANSVAPQPLSSKELSTEPVKAAEPAKNDGPASFNAATFQSSPFPHVSAASTSSGFSLSSFGAGSQPGMKFPGKSQGFRCSTSKQEYKFV